MELYVSNLCGNNFKVWKHWQIDMPLTFLPQDGSKGV